MPRSLRLNEENIFNYSEVIIESEQCKRDLAEEVWLKQLIEIDLNQLGAKERDQRSL